MSEQTQTCHGCGNLVSSTCGLHCYNLEYIRASFNRVTLPIPGAWLTGDATDPMGTDATVEIGVKVPGFVTLLWINRDDAARVMFGRGL